MYQIVHPICFKYAVSLTFGFDLFILYYYYFYRVLLFALGCVDIFFYIFIFFSVSVCFWFWLYFVILFVYMCLCCCFCCCWVFFFFNDVFISSLKGWLKSSLFIYLFIPSLFSCISQSSKWSWYSFSKHLLLLIVNIYMTLFNISQCLYHMVIVVFQCEAMNLRCPNLGMVKLDWGQ